MTTPLKNVPASVRAKLYNLARQKGQFFNELLTQYGMERFLHRLAQSSFRSAFVLKGGLLFYAPQFPLRRPTRDIDLQATTPDSIEAFERIFQAVCNVAVEPDGIVFQPSSVHGEPISADFQGVRIRLNGDLNRALITLQVDISFGNIITPGAQVFSFPMLLQTEALRLPAYPYATVLAEKLEAIVSLASDNSRLKDFYDLGLLAQYEAFEGPVLCQAIQNTFNNRGVMLPNDVPFGLTEIFSAENQSNWDRLFERYRMTAAENENLSAVLARLRAFLLPPLHAAAQDVPFTDHWPPGGPWQA